MRRRDFLATLGAGAAAAGLPRAADAVSVTQNLGISVTGQTSGGALIPANRVTDWTNPGMTSRGGIPNRSTIFTTLSPLGGGQMDDSQITAAIAACPDGQVVQLTAGVFLINGGAGYQGIIINRNNVTLRGAGPGQGLATGNGGVFVTDPTATQLKKVNFDGATAPIMINTVDPFQNNVSINLAADAPLNTNTITLASNPFYVGEFLLIDQITDNDPDVYWGVANDPPGGGTRRSFCRQDRSLCQIIEVVGVSGDTITTAAPVHCTFSTAYTAQVTRFDPSRATITGVGIEELYMYGGGGGHGHMLLANCAYCWIKHCDLHWFTGHTISLESCYRCEIRDSYLHETPDPNPGGGGYILDMTTGTADCLVENNISWYGNKNIVMRAAGGGNVIAYNYMDDAFGATYPDLPEAALNCEHFTTSHMELCEGNYAPNYTAGDFWGNNIDITLFRNHLSAIRAAHPPLSTFVTTDGKPYVDIGNPRFAISVHAHCYRQNFVGNILGKQGQQLISVHTAQYNQAQTSFVYEQINNLDGEGGEVPMWYIGAEQDTTAGPCQCWTFQPTTYQTVLREGNWDWVTQKQRWHGIGGFGPTDTSTPQPIPNSMYLSSKPAFFGSNTWPWVDPSSGTTYVLPAKARFDSGNYNAV
jgi:hypothetical protein